MGKSKTNKFKRPHFSVGLPVNAVKEVDVDEYDSDSPAAELLEKVRKQPIFLFGINAYVAVCLFKICGQINHSTLIFEK